MCVSISKDTWAKVRDASLAMTTVDNYVAIHNGTLSITTEESVWDEGIMITIATIRVDGRVRFGYGDTTQQRAVAGLAAKILNEEEGERRQTKRMPLLTNTR